MSSDHYHLACVHCGQIIPEAPGRFPLSCAGEQAGGAEAHPPALLRARYAARQVAFRDGLPGLFRYRDWLPVRRILPGAGSPAVFPAPALGGHLGLRRLYLAFNGYWPERGARLETASFKELEALAVCARLPCAADGARSSDRGGSRVDGTAPAVPRRTLVVASAGNTARAFLQVGSQHGVPLLVVVPEFALPEMWITVERHPRVRLAVLKGRVDYLDAIQLGNLIGGLDGYFPEGGARNVARRDGMGTVLLAAVEAIGEVPHHYVQAVGSGTGGIAVWEMNLRLIEDGRFGGRKTKLHFVQNSPFSVMADAWAAGSRSLTPPGERESAEMVGRLHARVLSNRQPPYGVRGGVFDALADTGGGMSAVSNEEARLAGELFERLEGCDLDPAAEVALAGLMRAAGAGMVGRDEIVLLNVTGGGKRRLQREGRMRRVQPDLAFDREESCREAVAGRLASRAAATEAVD